MPFPSLPLLRRAARLLLAAGLALPPLAARAAESPPLVVAGTSSPGAFRLAAGGRAAPVFVAAAEQRVVHIAAQCLADDIKRVTGAQPAVSTKAPGPGEYAVLVGTLGKSPLIDGLVARRKLNVSALRGQWEAYTVLTVDNPLPGIKHGLVLIGSDERGTAYSIFTLTQAMGVSPWAWWADVRPAPRAALYVRPGAHPQASPAVKYRGIFLNDEDWGLLPWAAKTYDPQLGDIGPKTYARVCELLLRLRANYLWPAMHEVIQAFNVYPGNKKVADDYAIYMGSSHHEPMLRNTSEYKPKTMGPWNYTTNHDTIYHFWDQRVADNGQYRNIYTIGMRGIGDVPMQGDNSVAARIKVMDQVFADQRQILARRVNPDVTKVPQVFVPYNEVLALYRGGLKVPEDVTLLWVDDNHGYIRQLSTPAEQKRPGGSGVYYHISYWGPPADYLWLNTSAPALTWEEMSKAYDYQARTIWIVNVGDLKPGEIGTDFFLDLAWDVEKYRHFDQLTYLKQWAGRTFGAARGPAIGAVLNDYYRLNSVVKPEYFNLAHSGFSAVAYGDEASRRLHDFDQLVARTDALYAQMEPRLKDAFYELVVYPVRGTALFNVKALQAERSRLYARQGRVSANRCADEATAAFAQIQKETDYFNTQLAGGKWNRMMDYKPRNQGVFAMPPVGRVTPPAGSGLGVAVENDTVALSSGAPGRLPAFTSVLPRPHFVDVFSTGRQPLTWQATASAPWLVLSRASGTTPDQDRLWVSVDWPKAPADAVLTGTVTITGAGTSRQVQVRAERPARAAALAGFRGSVEADGAVAVAAAHYTRATPGAGGASWQVVPDLGRQSAAVTVLPPTAPSRDTTAANWTRQAPGLEYELEIFTPGPLSLRTYCRPTHAANAVRGLRYAVALNDEAPQIVSLEQTVNLEKPVASKTWAANVLRSAAIGQTRHEVQQPGRQTLRIWMIDPGVVIDKLVGATGGGQLPPSFLGPRETTYPAPTPPATAEPGWGPHYPSPGAVAVPAAGGGRAGSR